MRRLLLLAALTALVPVAAVAADHTNLEEGLPVTIEDAYPIKQNGIEFQYYTQYDDSHREPDGKNRVSLVPRIEWGAFPNFQFSVGVPYRVGNAAETRQGDVDVQGLYNFNTEGLVLPAMSLLAGVAPPFGRMAGGTESELEFLATKSIGTPDPTGTSPYSYIPRELHFNAAWFHDFDPLTGRDAERGDRYRVGIGYSQPVTNEFVAVADVYRETVQERGKADNVAQIGTRYLLDPQTVLSASLGVGFGDDRDVDFRAVLGFQRTLSIPYTRP